MCSLKVMIPHCTSNIPFTISIFQGLCYKFRQLEYSYVIFTRQRINQSGLWRQRKIVQKVTVFFQLFIYILRERDARLRDHFYMYGRSHIGYHLETIFSGCSRYTLIMNLASAVLCHLLITIIRYLLGSTLKCSEQGIFVTIF